MEDTLGARVRRIRLELITPEDMREEDRSKRSVQMSENIKLLDSHGLDVGISALHSLQSLILYSFVISRPLMYSLSSPNPQLTTLILSSIFCRIPHHVKFLHLTRIHIDIRSISGRLASICAPKLQWISLNTQWVAAAIPFLQQNAKMPHSYVWVREM